MRIMVQSWHDGDRWQNVYTFPGLRRQYPTHPGVLATDSFRAPATEWLTFKVPS